MTVRMTVEMPSIREEMITSQVEICAMQTMAINLIEIIINLKIAKIMTKTYPCATDVLSTAIMLKNVETNGDVSTAKAMTMQLLTVPQFHKSMV